MITSTVIGTVTAFTNLTTYCMQLFLQKIIWLPRLLSQYIHKSAYSYTTKSTVFNICTKSVITNIKSVTNNIDKINGTYVLETHNNYIRSHYTTVDCNIKQAYTQS